MEESPSRGLSDLSSGGLPFPDMDFSPPTRKYQFNTPPLYWTELETIVDVNNFSFIQDAPMIYALLRQKWKKLAKDRDRLASGIAGYMTFKALQYKQSAKVLTRYWNNDRFNVSCNFIIFLLTINAVHVEKLQQWRFIAVNSFNSLRNNSS
jgi:hypothetical protein